MIFFRSGQILDDVAPTTMVGRQIKSTKEYVFATADDGEPVSDDADYIALCDQTAVGMGRFYGEGNPPDFRMGILYDGFVMPERETLGEWRSYECRDPATTFGGYGWQSPGQPELLARHCTEAALIEKAAGLWGKAGQRSKR